MEIDFTSVYEQHAPDVRRFVCYLTGSDDTAAEITSETFLRAWTTSGRIREESAKGYLLAIARNLVTDWQRRGWRSQSLAVDVTAPAAKPEAKRYLDQTMAAIQQLPDKYRLPLVMHAVGELPYEEIARSLELPLATVKVRIHRARLQLNEILQPTEAIPLKESLR
jgi:RNA polymerase sigma-70 factor (ECF subfamily)